MGQALNWGILGTGRIARTFCDAIEHSNRANLIGVASRTPGRPDIAERFAGVKVFPCYEAMLASPEIDAVYVSTNHSTHVELAKNAARAGKHIVCEKPVGISLAETRELLEVVREAGVFFMEAFMYRFHPQIGRAIDIVKQRQIGELRFIQAEFGFNLPFSTEHRIYDASDFGGGLLDAGGYPLSMARLFAGVAVGKPFASPDEMQAALTLHEVGVDNLALATLKFPGNVLAQISTGINLAHGQVARLYGTKGNLVITSPWFGGGAHGGTCDLILTLDGQAPKTITVEDQVWLYEHEVNAVTDGVAAGQVEPNWPAVTWQDTLENITWLEKWHDAGMAGHG